MSGNSRRIALLVFVIFAITIGLGAFGFGSQSGHLQEVTIKAKVAPGALIATPALDEAGTNVETSVKFAVIETKVTDLGIKENLLLLAWRGPSLVLGLTLLVLLWRLAVGIAQGEPFSDRSVWHLRFIAALLFVTPLLKYVTDFARAELLEYSSAAALPLQRPDFSYGFFLAALATFLLSEAFAAGKRARKEVEGLV